MPSPELMSILKENLSLEKETEEFTLYRTLLEISGNNFSASSRWLDNTYKERPLYLAMNVIIAQELGMNAQAKKAAKRLTQLQPNDTLRHLLYIDTHFNDEAPKAYARLSLNYLKKQNLYYNDLYFGPQVVRDKAISMAAITGTLFPLIKKLEKTLQVTNEDHANLITALALAHFYNQCFEKSYSLYNEAIDT